MPHCVIEISKQLSSSVTPTQLLRCVFDAHVKSGLFETDHIKGFCRKLFMKIQFAYLWAQLSSKARELLKNSFCRDP